MQVKVIDAAGHASFVCEYWDASTYNLVPRLSDATQMKRNRTSEAAYGIASQLRAKGIRAVAVTNDGRDAESIPNVLPTSSEDQTQPVTWRGITPKKIRDGLWVFQFTDSQTRTSHTLQGSSPEEVFLRLQIPHETYVRFLDSCPPEGAEPVQEVIPEPPQENPNRSSDGRVLRVADCRNVLPERRLPTPDYAQQNRFAEMEAFEAASSAQEYRERIKKDPAFAEFTNRKQ